MNDDRKSKSQLIEELQKYRKQHQNIHNRIRHFDSLTRISRVSLEAGSIEQVLEGVLDELLSLFSCDRVWLCYPCDPTAPSWHVPMERTRPEWPGANAMGVDFPMSPRATEVINTALSISGPVCYDSKSERRVPSVATNFLFNPK